MNKLMNKIINKLLLLILIMSVLTTVVSAIPMVQSINLSTHYASGYTYIDVVAIVNGIGVIKFETDNDSRFLDFSNINGGVVSITRSYGGTIKDDDYVTPYIIGSVHTVCAFNKDDITDKICSSITIPNPTPELVVTDIDISRSNEGFITATVFYTGTGSIGITYDYSATVIIVNVPNSYITTQLLTPITIPGTYDICAYNGSNHTAGEVCKSIVVPNIYNINILSMKLNNIINNSEKGWIYVNGTVSGYGKLGFDIDNVLKQIIDVTDIGLDTDFSVIMQTTLGEHTFCVYDYIISNNPTNICKVLNVSLLVITPTPTITPTSTITPIFTITPTPTITSTPTSICCLNMTDNEVPVLKSIDISTRTPYINNLLYVTVEATDNVAVTNVTADGQSLELNNNKWKGGIFPKQGTNTVMIIVKDAAGNTITDYSLSYTTITIQPTLTPSLTPSLTPISTPLSSSSSTSKSSNGLIDQTDYSNFGSARDGVLVYFNSTPIGATVYINRQYLGLTNITRNLQPGRWQFNFSLEGYKNVSLNVNYNNGITDKINVIFEPINQTNVSISTYIENKNVKNLNENVENLNKNQINSNQTLGTVILIILVCTIFVLVYRAYIKSFEEKSEEKKDGLIEKLRNLLTEKLNKLSPVKN